MRISDWSADVCSSDLEDIGFVQLRGDLRFEHARRRQGAQGLARIARPQRGIAPAMDKLMHLREEFDLPYAAASALEVISRPEGLPLRIMVADAARNDGDRVDGPEIQAAPPDEGADRLHEIIAERQVARRRSRPDERRLLPAERGRFIIADRRFHRQGDRRRLRRGAQAKVDAEHIAVAVAGIQQRSEEHTSELQSLMRISYSVFCLKQKILLSLFSYFSFFFFS